jgi:hypothetical protein
MASPTLIDAAQRMTTMAKKKGWVKSAIKHPGAFKAKAEAAGKTTSEFAAEHASDSGTLGKQARLAKTLMSMHHGPRRKLSYPNSK